MSLSDLASMVTMFGLMTLTKALGPLGIALRKVTSLANAVSA